MWRVMAGVGLTSDKWLPQDIMDEWVLPLYYFTNTRFWFEKRMVVIAIWDAADKSLIDWDTCFPSLIQMRKEYGKTSCWWWVGRDRSRNRLWHASYPLPPVPRPPTPMVFSACIFILDLLKFYRGFQKSFLMVRSHRSQIGIHWATYTLGFSEPSLKNVITPIVNLKKSSCCENEVWNFFKNLGKWKYLTQFLISLSFEIQLLKSIYSLVWKFSGKVKLLEWRRDSFWNTLDGLSRSLAEPELLTPSVSGRS